MAADPWGIEDRFHDAFGIERVTSEQTRDAILSAMGVDQKAPVASESSRVQVVRLGEQATVATGGGELKLEDGTMVSVGRDGVLPADLPAGYHTFRPHAPSRLTGTRARDPADSPVHVIVTPGVCFLPDDLKTWGWAVQLYATRSRASWGIGDLADLATVCAWTRELGGGAVMINPLSAPAPVDPLEPSPYYPSSRRFRNPLYLRIENIPGAAEVGPQLADLATKARALNSERRIDRNRVWAFKERALDILWTRFQGSKAFDAYRASEGSPLDEFAAYCVLAEKHGKDWRHWPAEFRHPAGAAVRVLIADNPRVKYHAWLQWLLDDQLRAASHDVRVIHDLPVGFDIAGADGWCWQDMVAADISIGVPPDGFNLDGQDWGLAPFIPGRLRDAGYAPFIQTIRSLLRHGGGLRVDHVMGLFRLFWIPRSLGNKGGTFVRYPAEELLAIVAIESQRARATIVGEDLGTMLQGTREILAAHRLLSYRLLYFESEPPPQFPELALSSVTTHDLATIAGIWTGVALDHARSAGVTPHETGIAALRAKLAALPGVDPDGSLEDVIVQIHAALATSPSRILLGTLDDALGVAEQPNMPGTTTSWPNWSLALPRTIEEIRGDDLPRRVAAALRR